MNTAFTEHEADAITNLGWYNDHELNEIILENYKANSKIDNKSCILDIGCGVGLMCKTLSEVFNNYIGIDNSLYMVKKAKQLHSQCRDNFYEGNILDILVENNNYNINNISHALLKNVLQFLDIETVLFRLRQHIQNGFIGQIVQTVNVDSQPDLFRYLYCLDFVKRTKKFYGSEELVDIILSQGFIILSVNNKYNQTILFDDWLSYHDVNRKQTYDTYKALGRLSNEKLASYNIQEKYNKYTDKNELYITRKLAIILFGKV